MEKSIGNKQPVMLWGECQSYWVASKRGPHFWYSICHNDKGCSRKWNMREHACWASSRHGIFMQKLLKEKNLEPSQHRDPGFQQRGFWITIMVWFSSPLAGFRIPKLWVPDSTDQNYLDSGLPYMGRILCFVSDIVFIAYGYVAVINSKSLRGTLGFPVLWHC